jgi:hypothetical protein
MRSRPSKIRIALFALVLPLPALLFFPEARCQEAQAPVTLTTANATTTGIAISPDSTDNGTPVTFTASVAPSQGKAAPTGTVGFYFGDYLLGTAPVKNGVASLDFSTAPVPDGTFPITAQYNGDNNYQPSHSGGHNLHIRCDSNSEISLAASPSQIYPGTPVNLQADVQPRQGGPSPTGIVLFFDGNHYLGYANVKGTVANFTVSTRYFPSGTAYFAAVYLGDKIYLPSLSNTSWSYVN